MNSAEIPHRNTTFSVRSVLRRGFVFSIGKPFLSEFITASVDQNTPSEEKEGPAEGPAPKNRAQWLSWFRSHSNLNISEPDPMRVGRDSAVRIDVTTTSAPGNYSRDYCERPCVLLYRAPGVSPSPIVSVEEGSKHRFIIVNVEFPNRGGKTAITTALGQHIPQMSDFRSYLPLRAGSEPRKSLFCQNTRQYRYFDFGTGFDTRSIGQRAMIARKEDPYRKRTSVLRKSI
jgi:hypothetical protein